VRKCGYAETTDFHSFDLAAVVAHSLENLLDLLQKTMMIDRHSQFDDTKMTWALDLVFFAGGAFEVSIDSAEMRVVGTFLSRSEARLIPEKEC
jgi:hypothetical protein